MKDIVNNYDSLSDFEKLFIEEFLNDLEKREDSQFVQPWENSTFSLDRRNAFTDNRYTGINAIFLAFMSTRPEYQDPRWATFNQARKNGYFVEKGSKGVPIQFFSFIDKRTKKIWNEEEFKKWSEGKSPEEIQKYREENRIPMLKTYYVFNASALISRENNLSFAENNPIELPSKLENTNELLAEFEKTLIDNMNVNYQELVPDRAFYQPATDTVNMPFADSFISEEARMTTLLHELGHATGHHTRLNRDLTGRFGSLNYSTEELRAELNSVFLANELRVELTEEQRTNHLKYLDSWGTSIKNDPKAFIKVISDSLKMKDYILEKGEFEKLFIVKENEKSSETNLDNIDDEKLRNDLMLQQYILGVKNDSVNLELMKNLPSHFELENSTSIDELLEIWSEDKSKVFPFTAINKIDDSWVAIDNLSSSEFNVEEFKNYDIAKAWTEGLNHFEANELLEALHDYSVNEFGDDKKYQSIHEIEDPLVGIAFTEYYEELFSPHKQISYDLINQQEVNSIHNEFGSISNRIDMSYLDEAENLRFASFDDYIDESNMGISRDILASMILVTALTKDESYITNWINENNYETDIDISQLKEIDPLEILSDKEVYEPENYIETMNDILGTEDFGSLEKHHYLMENLITNLNKLESKEIQVTDNPNQKISDREYEALVKFSLSHYSDYKVEDNKILFNPDTEDSKNISVYDDFESLWKDNYRNEFLDDFELLGIEEITSNNIFKDNDLLQKLSDSDLAVKNKIQQAIQYRESIKEVDLDNDGVPDRIDPDDNRNEITKESDYDKIDKRRSDRSEPSL